MLLKDKILIISGIGPGLGIELSTLAAVEGAAGLVVAARTPSKLDDAERQIRELGLDTPVLKQPTDIAERAQCDALVEAATARFGRVDALVNSAYVPGDFTPVADANLADWRRTFDVNLFGTLNLTQAVVPAMRGQGGGAVVMINTMVTRKPMKTQGGYSASKAALTSATAHLALELGADRIRVNSAYMGWMWGPPVEYYLKSAAKAAGSDLDSMRAAVAENIALGDIQDDADCAKAALFLASDYASALTGACLDVNGGEYFPR